MKEVEKLMIDVVEADYANGEIDDIDAAIEQVREIIKDMSISQRQRLSNRLPHRLIKRLFGGS